MRIGWFGGAVVALSIAGIAQGAHATTWSVTCTGNTTSLAQLSGGSGSSTVASATFPGDESTADGGGLGGDTGTAPDALGALLGTPDQGSDNEETLNTAGSAYVGSFTTSLSSGDLVEINDFCDQVVEIRTNNITLSGPSGVVTTPSEPPTAFALTNGVSNQVLVSGAHGVEIDDIMIGASVSKVSLVTSGFDFAGASLLTIVDGAQVSLVDAQIINSSTRGIFVDGNAEIRAVSSYIFDNGIGNADQTDNTGIFAAGASSVYLGKESGTDPTTVQSNAGDGIRIANGSSLIVNAGTITGNSQKQILALTASGVILNGNNGFTANGNAPLVSVSATSNTSTDIAVAVEAGSSLIVENQAAVSAGTSGTTIAAYGSGTVLLEGSFISGGSTTVEVTGGSLLALAGGNYICSGTLTSMTLTPTCSITGNLAIEVDHVGSLYDVGAVSGFNFTAAADNISGAGSVQLQSTIDLGVGLVNSGPSLIWTTGTNGLLVEQNSSLRMLGGVAITGNVVLQQGSNGFINKSAGTSNSITGSITCHFTTVPASHLFLSNETLSGGTSGTLTSSTVLTVSPATTPVFVASYATAGPGSQCLPF
jgi:hypothetical protein